MEQKELFIRLKILLFMLFTLMNGHWSLNSFLLAQDTSTKERFSSGQQDTSGVETGTIQPLTLRFRM